MLEQEDRMALDRLALRWIKAGLAREGVLAMPLTPELAVEAGTLDANVFPGDPADRMSYATARAAGAALITRDERLRDCNPRGTLW